MAGNSQRRGAMRKPGSKKGQTAGSGGQKSKGLKGKGPTPKAAARTGHPASRKAAAKQRAVDRTESGKSSRGASRAARPTRSGGEYVAGRNSVLEALRAQVPATTLYVAERIDSDDRVREALALANERGLSLLEVGRHELDAMTHGAVHQGVALQVPPYAYADVDGLVDAARDAGVDPFLVALDGVTDPRNLGAVVRTAAAFGAHGVFVPQRRAAAMTTSAWKASAGAAARVRVAQVTNLTRQLKALHDAGIAVVGLDAAGEFDVGEMPFAEGPLVLVVGAEGSGLSRLVREACDAVVSVPMAAGNESLNVAVAAGIALHAIYAARSA